MHRIRSLAPWWIAAVLAALPAHAQVSVGNIAFDQIDWFGSQAPAVTDSEWGQFSADITPDSSIAFLNVLANTGGSDQWVVRNLPVLPSSADPSSQNIATLFDLGPLGITRGTDLTTLDYRLVADAAPRTSAPAAGAMTTVAVGDVVRDAEGLGTGPLENPGAPADLTGLDFSIGIGGISFVWQLGMPAYDLDKSARPEEKNGCVSAAVTNSMEWLGAVPDPPATTFERVDFAMREPGKGVPIDVIVGRKLSYILNEKKNIRVKFQSTDFGDEDVELGGQTAIAKGTVPDFDFLCDELEDDEDVEIGMAWRRCTFCAPDGNGDMIQDIDAGLDCDSQTLCDALAVGDGLGSCKPLGSRCTTDAECGPFSDCGESGGHMVVVNGCIDLGFAHGIWTRDDGDDEHAGGTRTTFSWLKEHPNGEIEATGFARNAIDTIVSESPYNPVPVAGATGLLTLTGLLAVLGWRLGGRART